MRQALTLRLIDDLSPEEVCATLDITPANLWTMLHRARVRLGNCMDNKGLGTNTRGKP